MVGINAFKMVPVQGGVDLQAAQANVFSCAVDASQATALVAGQAVRIYDSAGGVPKVVAVTGNDDTGLFGFVVRNLKDIDDPALARLEIASTGTVMYMTAGAAIARGARVEIVNSTIKVITAAGTNPVVGVALDKASGDDALIRVLIISPLTNPSAATAPAVTTARVAATLAEINDGKVIIAGVSGKKIRVLDVTQRVAGNFAATTSVDLQDESATKALVSAVAALTNGAVLGPYSTNVTRGAGFAADLAAGEDLVVANVGDPATTGTSITYTVTYALIDA
jgi:hypothetical protein